MAKVEILTGADRQRRRSTEQKLSILQEAFRADGSVSGVKLPNKGSPFEGRRPIDVMIEGGIAKLPLVRRHVEALRGGL